MFEEVSPCEDFPLFFPVGLVGGVGGLVDLRGGHSVDGGAGISPGFGGFDFHDGITVSWFFRHFLMSLSPE